jgi:hypothetical protein
MGVFYSKRVQWMWFPDFDISILIQEIFRYLNVYLLSLWVDVFGWREVLLDVEAEAEISHSRGETRIIK